MKPASDVRWRAEELPAARNMERNSMWDRLIPSDLIRQMRLTPGKTYILTTKEGDPKPFPSADIAALAQASRRTEFRVQSRSAGGDERYVYVSFDPAYKDRLQARAKKNDGAK